VPAPTKIDTWNDCVNLALRKADEPSDYLATAIGTSDFADAAAAAALEVLQDLSGRHPWICLRKNPPGAFATFAADVTPTLTVPNSGVGVVCTLGAGYTVPGFPNLVGFKVRKNGSSFYSYITAHVQGSASITLDVVPQDFVGAGVSVTIYQDEYDLNADTGVLVSGMYSIFGYESYLWPEERIKTEYPGPAVSSSWPPRAFARIGKTRVRFSQYPSQVIRVEYQYNQEVADPLVTDPTGALASAIPLEKRLRTLWALGTTAKTMLYKSDSRAQIITAEYEAKIDDQWIYEGRLLRGWQSKYGNTAWRGPYA
jgi:hypothetical protein